MISAQREKGNVDPELVPLQPKAGLVRRPYRRTRLFVRFLAVLVAVYFFVDYALINPITLIRNLLRDAFDHSDDYVDNTLLVLPSDVEIKNCVGWTSAKEGWWSKNTVATTSLDLPVDSERLFFLREGLPISGTFKVVQGNSVSDNVHVEVVFTAQHATFVDDTRVCLLSRETGGDGVGILADFTPHMDRSDSSFGITVTLPQSAAGKLALKTFESNLPRIRQIFALNDNVNFERLSVAGNFAPIVAENIIANQVDLKTTHTSISGTVNASESLSLSTRNSPISGQFASKSISVYNSYAPISGHYASSGSIILTNSHGVIDAQIDLLHDGKSENPTNLELETSNAYIRSTIDVTSLASNGLGGSFAISSQTNNAFTSLKLPTISPQARVDITTSTNLAPISVELNEAWEGDYQVEVGQWGEADISVRGNTKVGDPEGRGRRRYHDVDGSNSKESYRGRVWWGKGDGGDGKGGSVSMKTSFSTAKLAL